MKKQLSLAAAVLFTAGAIFITGCNKDDTSPPSITLSGNSSMTMSLQGTYTEPGFTAEDDEDGDLTASVTSDMSSTNPKNYLKGIYTITYTVSDAAGNTGTATRVVTVVNDADYLGGLYNADDTCAVSFVAPYGATVTPSTSVNKQFTIKNFGGFGQTVFVTATISGTSVGSTFTWGAQALDVPTNILSAATNTGSVSSLSPVSFSFTYQWSSGGPTELCTSTYIHQ